MDDLEKLLESLPMSFKFDKYSFVWLRIQPFYDIRKRWGICYEFSSTQNKPSIDRWGDTLKEACEEMIKYLKENYPKVWEESKKEAGG